MRRYLATAVCLALALAFYGLGFGHAAAIFIVAGAVFEFAFWVRVSRHFKPSASASKQG